MMAQYASAASEQCLPVEGDLESRWSPHALLQRGLRLGSTLPLRPFPMLNTDAMLTLREEAPLAMSANRKPANKDAGNSNSNNNVNSEMLDNFLDSYSGSSFKGYQRERKNAAENRFKLTKGIVVQKKGKEDKDANHLVTWGKGRSHGATPTKTPTKKSQKASTNISAGEEYGDVYRNETAPSNDTATSAREDFVDVLSGDPVAGLQELSRNAIQLDET